MSCESSSTALADCATTIDKTAFHGSVAQYYPQACYTAALKKLGLHEVALVRAAGSQSLAAPAAACCLASASAAAGPAACRIPAVISLSAGPPRQIRKSGRLESSSE